MYLDFDNWVRFTRIRNGQTVPDGYLQLWEAANAAKERGAARFVLSAVHWYEAFAIKDPRQRGDLSATMGDVTDFASLLSRVIVVQLELGAAIGALLNQRLRWQPLPLVGEGFAHAFGINGLRIRDENGADVTEKTHTTSQNWAWRISGGKYSTKRSSAFSRARPTRRLLACALRAGRRKSR